MISFVLGTVAICVSANDSQRLSGATKQEAKKDHQPYNMPGFNFGKTDLDQTSPLNFRDSNFSGAIFSGTVEKPKIITNIDFSGCNLAFADFSHTVIVKCRFDGANLEQANFNGAKIKTVRFDKANIFYGSFNKANIEEVSFTKTNLQCTSWDAAVGYRISHEGADERGRTGSMSENHCSHDDTITSGFFRPFTCPGRRAKPSLNNVGGFESSITKK